MTTRCALLGTALLWMSLAPIPALAAEVVINEDARAHFAAGVNLLQDPDGARYEEAYREFKAAYAASPSWKILGNLAISAMKLERDGEAIDAMKTYLAEGGNSVDAEERAQFERDLATLQAGVVRLTLVSDPPGAILEDERLQANGGTIRNSYALNGPTLLGVRAGRHRFTAKLPGRVDQTWEVELAPRQQERHVFRLDAIGAGRPNAPSEAAPQPAIADKRDSSSGLRLGAYVALGVGVVGLGAGTVFGLAARSSYEEANDLTSSKCPSSGPCELEPALFDQREQLGKDGDRDKTLSLVGFVAGGAAVATGVTLLVLSRNKERPTAAEVAPYWGLGELGVRGSF